VPVETRISEEFGQLIGDLLGSDTYGQASVRTEVSQAYLLAMKRGKVPTRHIVDRVCDGYADRLTPEKRSAILVAAGHELPPDATSAVRIALRHHKNIPAEEQERIVAIVAEIEARLPKGEL
jgi:hypothetical protein